MLYELRWERVDYCLLLCSVAPPVSAPAVDSGAIRVVLLPGHAAVPAVVSALASEVLALLGAPFNLANVVSLATALAIGLAGF